MSSRLAKYFEGIEAAPPAIAVAQESNGSTGAEEIAHTPSAESLAVAKEFMAARSGVEDVGVAEQQLATVISGVGGFKSALEALNQKGGVSQEAAPLFEKAVNVYVTSVGLEAISLGFKHEEFNEQNPRQMASFEELDNVSAMFATATTQLETERANAEKRLTNAAINFSPEVVSTESFGEVTTEITTARVATQNEIKQAIVSSIQPLRQAMTDGNAAGGFGMESLLAISLGVEAFTQLLNRDPIELLGGVEGLNPEGLNKVGMEELDAVCAEVVVVDDGVVLDAGLDTTGNSAAAEVPVSDPVKPEAAPAPEVSEGEAPEVFDNEGTLSEAEVLELLTENEGDDETDVEDVVSQEGIKDIFKFITSREARIRWSVKHGPGDIAEAEKMVAELEAKIEKAKNENRPLTIKALRGELHMWQEEVADLKEMHAYFVAELEKIENRKKEAIAAKGKVSAESFVASFEDEDKPFHLDEYSVEDLAAGALSAAKLQSLYMKVRELEEKIQKLKSENGKLKSQLRKSGTASAEALEVSMEANIKDLKSGKKVKFSHGHGKIVKMFTAPFKYGHKEHHASKDEPRFLVKADKGGHYSIHKASALTLI